MDMLDQVLDNNSQDKGNESGASDGTAHIKGEGVTVSVNETVEEQAAAIASVTSQAASLIDPSVQYQFRAENGQGAVTYRVVQVAQAPDVAAEAGATAQVVTTAAAALVGQQVTQAIITSPFATANGGASPSAEGQFYVMMSPQDVIQPGQRTLAPRTHQFSTKVDGTKTARDERRRATHNEVERRRRDKINNWIIKLSKIVPDCASDHTKQGQNGPGLHSTSLGFGDSYAGSSADEGTSVVHTTESKGGILAKACDYIQDLRNSNARLTEVLKENERLALDIELLRQQCEELKAENQVLRAHLQQNGISCGEVLPGGS